MRLFIVRHGESENNSIEGTSSYEEYLANRSPDPALTALGEKQADAVAHHLATATVAEHFRTGVGRTGYDITRIYCSPMLRTMQTAQPIARALNINPEVMMDIYEHGGCFLGDPSQPKTVVNYPGLSRSKMQERFPGYVLPEAITEDGWWKKGYEDTEACYARAMRVSGRLRKMAEDFSNNGLIERVVLVVHATFIDALLKALFNQLPNPHFHYVHYNTAITRVDFQEGYEYLRYVNRTEHFSEKVFGELKAAAQHDADVLALPSY